MLNMKRILLLAGMRLGIPEATQFMDMGQPVPLQRGKRPYAIKRAFHKERTTLHTTNGEQECARRRRQIVCGQLKAENGLVIDDF